MPYQYVVLRCVPRVDREEFVNVGVVLYCQAADFLGVTWHVRRGPAPRRRPGSTSSGSATPWPSSTGSARATRAGEGGRAADDASASGSSRRPESTVLQPGPVHGGVTTDPARELEHLFNRLVG